MPASDPSTETVPETDGADGDGDAGAGTVESPPVHNRWEFTAAIILSVATVLSAWSGYESTRWGAKATRLNRTATNAMFQASTANSDGERQQMTDTSLFTEWVRAMLDGQPDRAKFVEARFRPGFLPAFHDWAGGEVTAGHGLPDGSPFQSPLYATTGFEQATKGFAQVESLQDKADTASRTSQTYVLIAVLYASVLFFGGVSTKLGDRRAARLLVVMAAAALIGATVELATQPVLVLIH